MTQWRDRSPYALRLLLNAFGFNFSTSRRPFASSPDLLTFTSPAHFASARAAS